MPEVAIKIGGRDYAVACQDGEEEFLLSAAQMLDTEATAMTSQMSGLPENRVLLMAGLMLADKTAGLDEQLKAAEDRLKSLEAELDTARNAPPPEPQRIEVAVIPDSVTDSLGEIAARVEALAEQVETAANG